jgi:hypothetical protein
MADISFSDKEHRLLTLIARAASPSLGTSVDRGYNADKPLVRRIAVAALAMQQLALTDTKEPDMESGKKLWEQLVREQ